MENPPRPLPSLNRATTVSGHAAAANISYYPHMTRPGVNKTTARVDTSVPHLLQVKEKHKKTITYGTVIYLFKDTFSFSDHISYTDRMNSEKCIGISAEGSGSGLIQNTIPEFV
jgi:hypothetical protein